MSVKMCIRDSSYPATGSDGGFFNVLRRDLDLAVTQLRPALTPVNVCGYPYRALAGIGLQNVQLTVWRQEKKAAGSRPDPGHGAAR